jgi:uncharacterized protein (TIGR03435 family)
VLKESNTMRTHFLIAAMVALAVTTGATAPRQGPSQGATAAFDVASIKENQFGGPGGVLPLRNGRWDAHNFPLLGLIAEAWDLPMNRVFGAPDWTRETHYDISAVAPEGATEQQVWPMVQSLLRERFKARAHIEKRDMSVYYLVKARADGRLGPDMKPSSINCDAPNWQETARANPGVRGCEFSFRPGAVSGGGTNMAVITNMVNNAAGRPVFDKTGLTGGYDFDLKWTPGFALNPSGDGVSIFTAVQEQLGLKLESATAPLDVLVVDHLERPTEN